jgi:hypothetical protein
MQTTRARRSVSTTTREATMSDDNCCFEDDGPNLSEDVVEPYAAEAAPYVVAEPVYVDSEPAPLMLAEDYVDVAVDDAPVYDAPVAELPVADTATTSLVIGGGIELAPAVDDATTSMIVGGGIELPVADAGTTTMFVGGGEVEAPVVDTGTTTMWVGGDISLAQVDDISRNIAGAQAVADYDPQTERLDAILDWVRSDTPPGATPASVDRDAAQQLIDLNKGIFGTDWVWNTCEASDR